jgi:TATA-box binding protein (TBP) (component of TFIID and TFIIIB)
MSNGNPTALQAVQAFLQRQKIDCELSEIQSGTQVTVRSGAMKAILNVYSSGKLVVGGADSSLKNTLEKLKAALESGEAIAGQALPFEIESFPDAIREKVPNCDPVIVAFVEEAIKCIKCDALLV